MPESLNDASRVLNPSVLRAKVPFWAYCVLAYMLKQEEGRETTPKFTLADLRAAVGVPEVDLSLIVGIFLELGFVRQAERSSSEREPEAPEPADSLPSSLMLTESGREAVAFVTADEADASTAAALARFVGELTASSTQAARLLSRATPTELWAGVRSAYRLRVEQAMGISDENAPRDEAVSHVVQMLDLRQPQLAAMIASQASVSITFEKVVFNRDYYSSIPSLKRLAVLLDTNVIVGALFASDRLHKISHSTLREIARLRTRDEEFVVVPYVSTTTIDELLRVLTTSERLCRMYLRLLEDPDRAHAALGDLRSITSVREYFSGAFRSFHDFRIFVFSRLQTLIDCYKIVRLQEGDMVPADQARSEKALGLAWSNRTSIRADQVGDFVDDVYTTHDIGLLSRAERMNANVAAGWDKVWVWTYDAKMLDMDRALNGDVVKRSAYNLFLPVVLEAKTLQDTLTVDLVNQLRGFWSRIFPDAFYGSRGTANSVSSALQMLRQYYATRHNAYYGHDAWVQIMDTFYGGEKRGSSSQLLVDDQFFLKEIGGWRPPAPSTPPREKS